MKGFLRWLRRLDTGERQYCANMYRIRCESREALRRYDADHGTNLAALAADPAAYSRGMEMSWGMALRIEADSHAGEFGEPGRPALRRARRLATRMERGMSPRYTVEPDSNDTARRELIAWVTANGLDAKRIPLGAAIDVDTEGGTITTEMYEVDENGKQVYSQFVPNAVARTVVTVPLKVAWPDQPNA